MSKDVINMWMEIFMSIYIFCLWDEDLRVKLSDFMVSVCVPMFNSLGNFQFSKFVVEFHIFMRVPDDSNLHNLLITSISLIVIIRLVV